MVREAISDLELATIAPEPARTAQVFAADKIFTKQPLAPTVAPSTKQARARRSSGWRLTAAFASICAALFLIAPSGAERMQVRDGSAPNGSGLDAAGAAQARQTSTSASAGSAQVAAKNPYGLAVPRIDEGVATLWKAVAAPRRNSEIESVTVQTGDTLRSLSLAYLGRFDVAVLVEISALNPEIVDPDRIEIGQAIRMPLYLRIGTAAEGNRTEKPPQESSPATQPPPPSPPGGQP